MEELDKYKNVNLNIGIVGESGSGKSTLINALRDLYPNDGGAAKTDVTECTTVPTPYAFPKNEKIILWDLPGYNTPNYATDNYLDNVTTFLISLGKNISFDCYIICSADRFKNNDLKIAKSLKDGLVTNRRNYFFVRTKFDLDIEGRETNIGTILNDENILKLSH